MNHSLRMRIVKSVTAPATPFSKAAVSTSVQAARPMMQLLPTPDRDLMARSMHSTASCRDPPAAQPRKLTKVRRACRATASGRSSGLDEATALARGPCKSQRSHVHRRVA